jgi:proline racemase
MKPVEYTEGPEELENFKRLATAILQAPAKKKKRQTKKSASVRKPKKSDRDQNGTGVSPAPVGA